jgi:NAD(P)-dependent dehydrogenase (short-subunit alcohol dehydrogenase family)
MSLKNKNVVVTGGSRGLGVGLVEALVAQGARVTVVARGTEALDAVAARLGVATISADVTMKPQPTASSAKFARTSWS